MDFAYTDIQNVIKESLERTCKYFDDQYWLRIDESGEFPEEFYQKMATDGWLGICIPEEFGGSGYGVLEAAIMMRAISESGAGMSGSSSIHINIFGLKPVEVYGNKEQKERMLLPIVTGSEKACFGVTEPDAGLNTTQLKLRATKVGDRYRVNGQKIWISTAQVADNILLLARTTPLEEVEKSTEGLSLFYTKLDRQKVHIREIAKMGRHAVDSNELFFDDFEIPETDLIGEEGKGFNYILYGLNPERILIAAEAIGLGMAALRKASDYARERVVFNRAIGKNQAIQHPLAASWAELQATWLQVLKAAWLYDKGLPCGADANAAKYLAGEAGFKACERAVMTHGGFGYAREYHVERYLREIMIPRIAPVSPQLALCYIAERVLNLPKSY
ncbi:Acyl-CoA dehydrogenase fadE12 [Oligella urethralis]|uniref:acyl-CoA dehydrogenase family protein n=1 Tax=Oligella urethralis TaxID=90245 RepID=UPI000E04D54B|nr:acyl-CoA dehydrogenase family protein [Oligella urethralis]SUA52131.1 Acyl-CoA dehydrogenase fadE12 [Oligella urethralis]